MRSYSFLVVLILTRISFAPFEALSALEEEAPNSMKPDNENAEEKPQVIDLEPETGPPLTHKYSYSTLAVKSEKPNIVQSLPENGDFRFIQFPWGDDTCVVAFEKGLKRFWPDRDCDGDLAEESPVTMSSEKRLEPFSVSAEFDLMLKFPDRVVKARMVASLWGGANRVYLNNLTRMSGEVKEGSRTIKVSLTDYLVNGRYDDYYTTSLLGTSEY